MLRTTENTLKDISIYESNIAKLSFYHLNNIDMTMDKLSSNLTESSYSDIILDFDSDINKTTQYISELQEAILSSNNKYVADGIDLKELFPDIIENNGVVNVMGLVLGKQYKPLDKKEIKKSLLQNILGVDFENYPAVYKAAKTKKADDITLPINATEKEKITFLALKGQESMFFNFAERINQSLNLYRDLRRKLSNRDLKVLDEGIHGFTRTGVDGVIQQSTYFDSDEIYQISTKHQKDIKHLSNIKKTQALMKEVGITEVEIDQDDSIPKFYNFLESARDFTLNTTTRFSCKSRKLGNYSGQHSRLFGLFLPSLKMIAVDSRDPSALVHEFTHAVDFNNNFVSEKTRMQFINLASSVLNKQYFPNVSVYDIAKNYDKLHNNQDKILSIVEDLYKNNPHKLQAFKSSENKELSMIHLAVELSDSTLENQLLTQAVNSENKYFVRKALNDFSNLEQSPDFNIDAFIRDVDYSVKYQRDYRDETYKELAKYLIRNHSTIEQDENRYLLPPNSNYLFKPEEIIARAGEIGYILSKYGYEGHENQGELDTFIDKVRKIQEIEKEEYGTIRACHSIDTYIKNKEYFGLVNSSESFLLTIKDYYKPFFQPKKIYDLDNDDIKFIDNNNNLEPVNKERLERLMELSRIKELEIYEIKEKLKSNRRSIKKERKSFDKNKHPLAYLKEYEGLEGMIKYNSKHGVIEPEKLFLYIVQNISDLGKTTLNEKVDIDKTNKRIEVLARIIANKEQFDDTTQKAISAFERGNQYEKNLFNTKINTFFRFDIKDDISKINVVAPKTIQLSLRGRDLDIYGYILELSNKFKENPSYDGQISLNKANEILDLSVQRKKNADEGLFNVFNGTVSGIAQGDNPSIQSLKKLSAYFTNRIEQSETKEESLMVYLKSLGSISDALSVNFDEFKDSIAINNDDRDDYKYVFDAIKHLFNKLEDDSYIAEDYFNSISFKGSRSKFETDFKFINDETKRKVIKSIIDSEKDGEFHLVKTKTKQPKGKKLIQELKSDNPSMESINQYLNGIDFNHLDRDFAKEILINPKSYNDLGKMNALFYSDYLILSRVMDDIKFKNKDNPEWMNQHYRQEKDKVSEFISYFKNNIIDGVQPQDIQRKINDPKFKDSFVEIFLKDKEIKKYAFNNDKDTYTTEEKNIYNKSIFNDFIKPLNESLSQKGKEHVGFVFEALNKSFNAPESPFFKDTYVKKAFATYLTVLFKNNVINDPIEHTKDVKVFVDYINPKDMDITNKEDIDIKIKRGLS